MSTDTVLKKKKFNRCRYNRTSLRFRNGSGTLPIQVLHEAVFAIDVWMSFVASFKYSGTGVSVCNILCPVWEDVGDARRCEDKE